MLKSNDKVIYHCPVKVVVIHVLLVREDAENI